MGKMYQSSYTATAGKCLKPCALLSLIFPFIPIRILELLQATCPVFLICFFLGKKDSRELTFTRIHYLWVRIIAAICLDYKKITRMPWDIFRRSYSCSTKCKSFSIKNLWLDDSKQNVSYFLFDSKVHQSTDQKNKLSLDLKRKLYRFFSLIHACIRTENSHHFYSMNTSTLNAHPKFNIKR